MHTPTPTLTTGRRGFLARLSAAAAAFATPALASASTVPPAAPGGDDAEPWLRALQGKHRQLFHSHDKMDGTVLAQARAFYDLYGTAYGVTPKQLSVVIAAHGSTGGMLFGDALWAKYELGKMYRVTMRDPNAAAPDATAPAPAAAAASTPAPADQSKPDAPKPADPRPGRIPATRNVFSNPQPGDPVNERTSIEALRQLGATFLLCDNALTQFSGYLARRSGSTQDAAYQELRANLLPGTVLVPTMLIAINRAQERGCSYLYSG
ncbi:MAG TPA: hypothetical protein VKA84_08470 [Gemmatimonadaceae bacterium]|nr:hypothetical protein [Gemmatimonadaceae bacterium]